MTQFGAEIRERVREAMTSLDRARQDGDDHMVEVRVGELESLAHLAGQNGLRLPALEPYAARVADAG